MENTFTIGPDWINKLLAWADPRFPYIGYFNPHSITYPYGGFEHLFFAGEKSFPLAQLKDIPDQVEKVGILSYDLKNSFEKLSSQNPPLLACADSLFFIPTLKIKLKPGQATIFHPDSLQLFEQISTFQPSEALHEDPSISSCTTKE